MADERTPVTEEVIEETKVKNETEAGFRLPPGFDQMLGSMLNNNNIFDQFIQKPAQPKGPTSPESRQGPQTVNPDFNRVLEQTMGMMGTVLQGHGDVFGKFFNQPKPEPEPASSGMYPKLDGFEEDKPAPKPKSTPQTINIGDVLGGILGVNKPKESGQSHNAYPDLDSVEGRPKPSQPQGQINIEQVINQGIEAIGAALKGNAGDILSQILKPGGNQSPQPQSVHRPEPVRDEIKIDTIVEPPKPVEPEPPKEVKPSSPPSAPDPPKTNEQIKERPTANEKILDSIDDAFDDGLVEAFDGLIAKQK